MTDTIPWPPPQFQPDAPIARPKGTFPPAIAAIFLAVLALVTVGLLRTVATAETLVCEADYCPSEGLTFSNVVADGPGYFQFGIACNAAGIAIATFLVLRGRSGAATTIAIALIGITFFCCTAAYLLDAMGRAIDGIDVTPGTALVASVV